MFVPSESPIWNREASAHLLRDSDSEDGIFHALLLPPTNNSLASVKEMKRYMNNIEDSRALCKAMVDIILLRFLRDTERERERERERE